MAAYRIIETESQSQNALARGALNSRAFQTRRIGRCCDVGDFVAIAMSTSWYPQGITCPPGRVPVPQTGCHYILFRSPSQNFLGRAEESGRLYTDGCTGWTGLHTGLVVVARANIA